MFKFPCAPGFLEQFRAGDARAIEQIYFAYVDQVVAVIRQVGGRSLAPDNADLQDLVHDAFARAFGSAARGAFDGTRDYGPYLGKLTKNLVIDWARERARRASACELDASLDIAEPSADAEPSWADPTTMDVVSHYVAALPEELRQVHEQRYVHCRSQEAACASLGISRQQLRTREQHLRRGLERELKRAELARTTRPERAERALADIGLPFAQAAKPVGGRR